MDMVVTKKGYVKKKFFCNSPFKFTPLEALNCMKQTHLSEKYLHLMGCLEICEAEDLPE